MNTDQWIATGSLALALVSMLVGGVVALVKVAYKLGAHAERLTKLENAGKDSEKDRVSAQVHTTELAVMTEIMSGMKGDLAAFMEEARRWKERVDGDIRSILLSKPAARRPGL